MPERFTYCPRCAAALADDFVFGRVRRRCRDCSFIQFHDPKVAVAGLVSDGGRVLLVRRAVVPAIGFWALPAGYMDADELPHEAVVREIVEETGVAIEVLGLHSIAPLAGWNERRGILLIYRGRPIGGGRLQPPAAQDDVSEARWFSPAEIPWDALAFESTAQVLREWGSTQ
jgi:ADP-ribose pyrophosphatase YjhB (NUDIX family)